MAEHKNFKKKPTSEQSVNNSNNNNDEGDDSKSNVDALKKSKSSPIKKHNLLESDKTAAMTSSSEIAKAAPVTNKTFKPLSGKERDSLISESESNLSFKISLPDIFRLPNGRGTNDNEESSVLSYLDLCALQSNMIFYRSLNGESSNYQLSQNSSYLASNTDGDASKPANQNEVPETLVGLTQMCREMRDISTNTSENARPVIATSEVPEILPIGEEPGTRQYLYEATTAEFLVQHFPYADVQANVETPGEASSRHQGTNTLPGNTHGDFCG